MKKTLLYLNAILLAMAAGAGKTNGQEAIRGFTAPAFLNSGDSVAVVAVSSKITDSTAHCIELCRTLEDWGLKIRYGEHLFDTTGGWFPAPDSIRAADLQSAMDNPNVRAIIFYRGGYGAARVIPYLDCSALSKNPKWLVGFSDVTVMLYMALSEHIQSIHGTMPLDFAEQPFSVRSLHDALFGELRGYETKPDTLNIYGTAVAPLAGGNLTLVSSVAGTGIDFDYSKPYILFIEDIGEAVHATDRRLQNMKQSGRLKQCKGIIVGSFKDTSEEAAWGSSVYRLIHDYAAESGVPALFGFPAGHIDTNCSLYMGRVLHLTVDSSGGHIAWE